MYSNDMRSFGGKNIGNLFSTPAPSWDPIVVTPNLTVNIYSISCKYTQFYLRLDVFVKVFQGSIYKYLKLFLFL